MRTVLNILVLAALLGGCAGLSPAQQSFLDYKNTQKPRAERGEIKWSEYYLGLYERGRAINAPGAVLSAYNEGISASQDFEAGRIDKPTFDYRIRAITANMQTQVSALQTAERQASLATTANSLAIANSYKQLTTPQVLAPPTAVPTQPVVGMIGFLKTQQVNGFLRYCTYSNGVVLTVQSVDLCQMQSN